MVIDEADRMLDMGFIPDVKKIIYKLPKKEKDRLYYLVQLYLMML